MIKIHAAKAGLSSHLYPNHFNYFPSSSRQQLYPEILPQTEKVRKKSGAKLDSSESADSQIQHDPTQSSPAASSVGNGEWRSWINEMFKENNGRKLRIQCLWADKGGVMLDLSLSHGSSRERWKEMSSSSLCPHTARKTQPALNKAPQSNCPSYSLQQAIFIWIGAAQILRIYPGNFHGNSLAGRLWFTGGGQN